jgi:hypothetical protein
MLEDRAAIVALVQDWVVFRDSGFWDRLRAIWGPEGTMCTTWFQGSADDFVAHNKHTWGAAVPGAVHMLGGTSVDVNGDRAVSQTKMTISIRAALDGAPCAVTCEGRFYDCWYKDAGRWWLADRHAIYERDRLEMLDGAPSPALDADILESFPPGYRHLAYVQQAGGTKVKNGLPGLTGAAVEALYAKGRSWLRA